MTVNKFMSLVDKNLIKLLRDDIFIKAINRGNNLYRFDAYNRIFFALNYDDEPFDLRTEQEWFSVGRRVINNDKVYNAIVPSYKTVYKDSETDELFDVSEFSMYEFKKAVELGVIYKSEGDPVFSVGEMYDIRNTKAINKDSNCGIVKPKISIMQYADIVKELTGITVESSDETYFSKSDKHLFLSKCSSEKVIDTLTEILVNELTSGANLEFINDSVIVDKRFKIDDNSLKLIRVAANFSIESIFNLGDANKVVAELANKYVTDYMDIMAIINVVDSISYTVVSRINLNNDSKVTDNFNDIDSVNKAKTVFNLLVAAIAKTSL